MSYRDDLDAAHERLHAMEAELAELREDHAEERERIEAERDAAVKALDRLRDMDKQLSELREDSKKRAPIMEERDAALEDLNKLWSHHERHEYEPSNTPRSSNDLYADHRRSLNGRSRLSRLIVAMLIMCGVWTSTLVLTAIHPLLWLIAFFALPLWYILYSYWGDPLDSCESSFIAACFIATLPMVNNAPWVLHGLLGDAVTEVTLDEANEHQDLLLVKLNEGRVATDHQLRGSWAIEDGQMNALIAPIVSEAWHSGQPITAWAVCLSSRGPESLEECTSQWEESHQGGVVLEGRDGIDWAIRDGLRDQGLIAEDDAMLIGWNDPAPILRSQVHLALWSLLGCYVLWMIWFLIKSDP